jgi:hypothetical protein
MRSFVAIAAFALAACGQSTSAPAAPEAAADASLPTPGGSDAVTAEFLVGAWGDNGDCSSTITYNADGTFRMQDGSTGAWTLEGDRVTMTGERGAFSVQVAKGNDRQLLIGQPDGGFGISQRC